METNFQDQLVKVVVNGDNCVVANSLDVAKAFDREHKHVLRSIRSLIDALQTLDIKEDFNGCEFGPVKSNGVKSNGVKFAPVKYVDAKGEERPAYEMDRDGFSLLAMGFDGEKALLFKVKFINAFNKMEAALTQRDAIADVDQIDAMLNSVESHSNKFDKVVQHVKSLEKRLLSLEPFFMKLVIDKFKKDTGVDLCTVLDINYKKVCELAKASHSAAHYLMLECNDFSVFKTNKKLLGKSDADFTSLN